MSLATTSHTATHRGVAVTSKPEPVPSGSSASGPRTTGSPTPLVEVRNLDVRFTGARRVHAVRGVSFTINPGEALAIVGESGSGKSVTSRSIVGLAGDNAELTADQFSVIGQDGLRLREGQWRAIRGRRIGFVLQDALTSLDPLRTIGREITETLRAHRIVPRRQYGERVDELLREVGIPDPQVRSRQYPHQLSGGLRQRALIASALAGAPDLLIADEPTTALDVTVQAQILDLLESRRAEGTALLLVSHDLAVVSRVADRVLVMHDGVVVEQGPTEKVLTAPEHEYTKALLAAVPSASTRGTRLSASPGIRLRARAEAPLRLRQETEGQVDTGTPVLAAHNVSKSFPLPDGGTRTAVDHVSLTLKAGQKLGIVGESGSGKSTLARLLLDLTRPDEGSIEIGGVQISGPSGQDSRPPTPWARHRSARSLSPALRRQVQFISQDPLGSFDPRYTTDPRDAPDVRRPLDAHDLPPEVIASLSPIPSTLWFRELQVHGRELALRHALPEEYPEVGDVLETAFTTGCTSTPEYVASLHAITERARTSNVWVITDDRGVLAAVLTPMPRFLDSDTFTFNILGVGPRARGLGLGRVLTDHAVAVARALGLRRVDIHSGPQMTWAHRMYLDYGFVRRIDWETAVVDGHQRLRSFSYRITDPAQSSAASEYRLETSGGSVSTETAHAGSAHTATADLASHRPAGEVDDAGRFIAEEPSLPGPAELPDTPLRLMAPTDSPRSWGAVLGARFAAPDWVSVELTGPGSASSPQLVDASGNLVSDDWAWISRSLAAAADSPLYPAARRDEIDRLERLIDEEVIGGLEQAIFSTDQPVRDAVERLLFARLGMLDLALHPAAGRGQRFLLGNELSTADLALFGTLVGWDLCYRGHLGWGSASLVDYPQLWAWARRVLAVEGLVGAEDRVLLGLEPDANGSFHEAWGPAEPVEGVPDIRAAWRATD